MAQVAILGLGSMGLALTRALLGRGHQVTVWNRSLEKAAPLVQEGAVSVRSPALAVASASLVVMCVLDYDAATAILRSPGVAEALKDKTLVQLSTGFPGQISAQRDWVHQQRGNFIAGGILAYPSSIGQPNCVILYAGDAIFETHKQTLAALAGSLQYLGHDPAMVVGGYFTLSSFMIGSIALFFETAALASHYGISIDTYYLLGRLITDEILVGLKDGAHRIATKNFDGRLASIDLTIAGMQSVIDTFKETGIPARMTEALVDQLSDASGRGHGGGDISSLLPALLGKSR
jgi:3-hydroxyisobutyrate dehydrogenase-like beta-hydroxyacid dehydrogenase